MGSAAGQGPRGRWGPRRDGTPWAGAGPVGWAPRGGTAAPGLGSTPQSAAASGWGEGPRENQLLPGHPGLRPRNARMAPAQTACPVSRQLVPVHGPVTLRGRQRMPLVCNAVWLKSLVGVPRTSGPISDCSCWAIQVPEPRGPQEGTHFCITAPVPTSPESQGGSGGMDMDGPGSPPRSDRLFLLGQAWHASSLSTCPGSPALQLLHSPFQPRTWQEHWSEPLTPPSLWGLRWSGPVTQGPCCSPQELSLAEQPEAPQKARTGSSRRRV